MCRFLETLRIEQGRLWHLPLHQARLERTLRACCPGAPVPQLEALLQSLPLTEEPTRLRVVYGPQGVEAVETFPYALRNIRSLRLVPADGVDYAYKRADRRVLDHLLAQRGTADEVLLVQDGRLTDTSFSNIALSDGLRWYTPAKPLLAGTMRQHLLAEGRIAERDILAADLPRYHSLSLINAMLPLGRLVVPVRAIQTLCDRL